MSPTTLTLLALPFIGALIGWVTNTLAVKMIFRPREPVSVLGFKVQGVLPKRRSELAASVADTVEQELLSAKDIQDVVKGLTEDESLRASLRERLDVMVEEQLNKMGPMVRSFAGGLTDDLKARLEEEILAVFTGLSEQMHAGIERQIDVREMVRERIEGFDVAHLERVVYRIAARELKHVEILGGVLGFAVGAAESLFLWWAAGP
ncbi:MAG: DUF445 family protein [Acidobacteriota bacterium]